MQVNKTRSWLRCKVNISGCGFCFEHQVHAGHGPDMDPICGSSGICQKGKSSRICAINVIVVQDARVGS